MKYLPWLALLGVAWFGGCQYAENRQADARIAELQQSIGARETVIAALARQKAKVDTVAGEARTAYVAAVQGWDSIKVTLGEKHPVVLAGDKVAGACSDALRACASQVAARDALLAQKDTVIWAKDSLLALKPRGTDWKTKLGLLMAGAATVLIVK